MKLLVTKTMQGTELIICPKHVCFIQRNSNLGFVIVMGGGAGAHNLTETETARLVKMMEEIED